jgi:glycyl-tRNA synthetase beta subunit
MCEDQPLRRNRLTLLHKLNGLFLEIADISRLQG